MSEIIVAKVGELAHGQRKIVQAGGTEIAVFNLADKYYAIENFCPHQGGPVGKGDISDGDIITCPLHEWRFNIKTGACADFSGINVKSFPVNIYGNEIKIIVE